MSNTYACSCAPPDSPMEELNNSSAVFSGKVVEITDKNKNAIFQSSADLLDIRFTVNKTWKGIDESEVVVKSSRDSASCGFEFVLNEEYLVYANEIEGDYHVNLCSRTASLSEASMDMEELGHGELPTKLIEEVDSEQSGINYQVVLLILLFIFSVLGFLFIRRRNK